MNTAEQLPRERMGAATGPTICFSVHGAADPGLLPRVIGLWSKRGLMPARWHSAVCGPDDREMYIDVEVTRLSDEMAGRVARELRQIWGVSQVLVSFDRDRLEA